LDEPKGIVHAKIFPADAEPQAKAVCRIGFEFFAGISSPRNKNGWGLGREGILNPFAERRLKERALQWKSLFWAEFTG
jgi:hypothetical protein